MIVKDPDEVNEDCMILQKIVSVYSCRLLLLGYLADTMLINMCEACKALCLKVTHCRPRSKVKTIPCQD